MAKTTRMEKCPICDKLVNAQGMGGHIALAHKLKGRVTKIQGGPAAPLLPLTNQERPERPDLVLEPPAKIKVKETNLARAIANYKRRYDLERRFGVRITYGTYHGMGDKEHTNEFHYEHHIEGKQERINDLLLWLDIEQLLNIYKKIPILDRA